MSQFTKRTAKHKIASVALSVTTALWLSGAAYLAPVVAGAQSAADLQTQIQALLAQIATLQSQLSTLQGGTTTTSAGACGFTRALTVGSTGEDVRCLQKYLNDSGYQIAASGVGSPGNETTYFGSLTRMAVGKWQAANGVSPAAGYFGSLSQAKYNTLAGGTTTTGGTTGGTTLPPAPVGTGLTVTAGTQPASSLFPINSTRVPFTVLRLTAPANGSVTVDSITVERTGLANDAAFSGVLLLDENGTQVGLVKTLNSVHQAILTEDFTVNAGQTRTMTIAGNAQTSAGSYGGQIAYLSIVGVAANAPVSTVFPITGAGHTINETLSIGTISTVARGSLDPGSSQTKEVGTTNYTFSSVKFTSGSQEDVYIKYIRWYQSGSASKDDLSNVKVLGNGGEYMAAISTDGKYYTTVFTDNGGKGILMQKGFSREFTIKADITSGSARTVDFDIQKRTDVAFVGETYGYGISPPFGSGTTADAAAFRTTDDPYYDAAQVEVSQGSMTVSTNATLAPATNVAVNIPGQTLAAFTTDVRGEPITVARLAFNVTLTDEGTSETAADLTSFSLYDENGSVIAGPVDGTATEADTGGATGTANGELIFTDTVTFPVGMKNYILKGKFGTDFDNDDTVQASTTPSDWGTVTGQVTGKSITPNPNSALSFSTMTVKTGALTVSVSSIPIAQTVIRGVSQFTFANYILDATAAGEDIRLVSLPVEYNFSTGSGSATDLTNCKMYDGAVVINSQNIKNPSAKGSSTSFVFDGSGIILAKGNSKTLTLKCDVSGSATNNGYFEWGIDGAEDTNFTGATGLNSGQTVAETFTDSAGQKMTVSTGGTLTVSLDAGSPGYTVVGAGSAGVTLSKIRFTAANEDIDLRQVALQLTENASNTPVDLVSRKVTLWDGSTLVGEAIFPTGDTATSSTITNFRIPRGSAKVLTVKGDIAAITGDGPLTASGDLLKIDYDGDNEGTNGNYGVGVASGSNVTPANSDTASNGARIYKAYPVLTKLTSLPTYALSGGTQSGYVLYRFKIEAKNGDLAIYKFQFDVSSSTQQATTSTYGLYVYDSSTFSTGLADQGFTNGLINFGNCVNGDNKITNTTQTPGVNNSPLQVMIHPDKGTTACNGTTTYTIPAGATRWFQLKGTIANVETGNTVTDQVSVRLSGDAAFPTVTISGTEAMRQAAVIDGVAGDAVTGGDTNDDFIWSPISTTTAVSRFDNDFTNGYGIFDDQDYEYFSSN